MHSKLLVLAGALFVSGSIVAAQQVPDVLHRPGTSDQVPDSSGQTDAAKAADLIEKQRRLIDALKEENAALHARVKELETQIEAHKKQLDESERRRGN